MVDGLYEYCLKRTSMPVKKYFLTFKNRFMKLSQICLIFISFFMVACGGDDDGLNPDATLIGTWEAQSFTSALEVSTDFSDSTTETTINLESSNLNYSVTFSETNFSTEGSYDLKGEIIRDGTTNTVIQSHPNISRNGDYRVDGDKITHTDVLFLLDIDGVLETDLQGETTVTIEKLSDNELIVTQDLEEEITEFEGGSEVKITAKYKSRSIWKRK